MQEKADSILSGFDGVHFDIADPTSTYGSMASLALAMLWIYYASLVVFVGALFTAVVDERARA